MDISAAFFINSVLLGVGLAADAFSVSVANGILEYDMARKKRILIAGTFGFFQTLCPIIGYVLVRTAVKTLSALAPAIPYIALVLLVFLGVRSIIEAVRKKEDAETPAVTKGKLLLQGIATSIDALTVGFTISELHIANALVEALIIGVITFGLCLIGIAIGRKAGEKWQKYAGIIGGVILIAVGVEIFLTGILS